MKKIAGLLGALFLLGSVTVAFAQDLTLTQVGTLSTVGVDYSTVNYVGAVPMLSGTASPSALVTVKIKTISGVTTASTSGVWQFTPTTVDAGSNSIIITSGTQSLAFILNFNATTPTATPTPTVIPTELPQSGEVGNLLLVIVMGLGVIYLGRYIKQKMLVWEGKKR